MTADRVDDHTYAGYGRAFDDVRQGVGDDNAGGGALPVVAEGQGVDYTFTGRGGSRRGGLGDADVRVSRFLEIEVLLYGDAIHYRDVLDRLRNKTRLAGGDRIQLGRHRGELIVTDGVGVGGAWNTRRSAEQQRRSLKRADERGAVGFITRDRTAQFSSSGGSRNHVHRDSRRVRAAVSVLDGVVEGVLPGGDGNEDNLLGWNIVGSEGNSRNCTGRRGDLDGSRRVELNRVAGIRITVVGQHVQGHVGPDRYIAEAVVVGNRVLVGRGGGDLDVQAVLPGCGLGIAGFQFGCGFIVHQQAAFAGSCAVGCERGVHSELDLEQDVVVTVVDGRFCVQGVVIEDDGNHAGSKVWIGIMRSFCQRRPAALDGTHSHGTPTGLVIRELQADTLVALAALDTGGLCVQGELLPGDIGANSVRLQLRYPSDRGWSRGDIDQPRGRVAVVAVAIVQDEGHRPGVR